MRFPHSVVFSLGSDEHACVLADTGHNYTCDSFEQLVEHLHVKDKVNGASVSFGESKRKMKCTLSERSMRLFTTLKSNVAVKLKHIEYGTTPNILSQDLDVASSVSETISRSPILKTLVARHAEVVPGYICVMERCHGTAWKKYYRGHEQDLLNYLWFGANLLGTLASKGLEARDYKASNVGVRRPGSEHEFCLIDTAMIVPLTLADAAACTYPVVSQYTFGVDNSLVGLAATAWAWIADACAMIGYDCQAISHNAVFGKEPLGCTDRYARPLVFDGLREFVRSDDREVVPWVSSIVDSAMSSYVLVFESGREPATDAEAIEDAGNFWKDVRHIFSCIPKSMLH